MNANSSLWRLVQQLTALLAADESVTGLMLCGSLAKPNEQVDEWSDVDLNIIVTDDAYERLSSLGDWPAKLGKVYACEVSPREYYTLLRLYYEAAAHLDAMVIPEAALANFDHWPLNPFRDGFSCLFSRTAKLDGILRQQFAPTILPEFSPESFSQMCNQFRFKAMLAVNKAARNDLLVALHLALDLVRDCLVLGMILRDRALGTNHHREGSAGQSYLDELKTIQQQFTKTGILRLIEESSEVFDSLAAQWDNSYRADREPLLALIKRASKNAEQD